ncbi:hypothetical protein ES703_102313 [subsurface metagenome]
MANDRAVCRDTVSVYPHIKYPVAVGVTGVEFIVALKIVHDKIFLCRKVPEPALPGCGGLGFIDLIDPPVVSLP